MDKRGFLGFVSGVAVTSAAAWAYDPVKKYLISPVDPNSRQLAAAKLAPWTVDLHYGILRGTGWLGDALETGGTKSISGRSIAVSNPDGFIVKVDHPEIFSREQLICYKGLDGRFHSSRVVMIGSNTLTLGESTAAGIDVDAIVTPFYANNAHPNVYGSYCIVDQALDQLANGKRLSLSAELVSWQTFGDAKANTVSVPAAGNDRYSYPTSGDGTKLFVFDAAPGAGAETKRFRLPAGTFIISIPVSFLTGSSVMEDVRFDVEAKSWLGQIDIVQNSALVLYEGPHLIKLTVVVERATDLLVKIKNTSGNRMRCAIGAVAIAKAIDRGHDFNRGTHVLFGDSWFASGFLMDRLQKRLPSATFINQGIGGNRASQLLERFDTDVMPHKPDYVWVIVGTNDYYAQTGTVLFNRLIAAIKSKIKDIGAQAIFFDASVGDVNYSPWPGERLTASRQYQENISYQDELSNG